MERWIDRRDWIELSSFKRVDYPRLVREYFWYANESYQPLQKLSDVLFETLEEQWGPEELRNVKEAADRLFRQGQHLKHVGSRI
jgi:hypothetical protein